MMESQKVPQEGRLQRMGFVMVIFLGIGGWMYYHHLKNPASSLIGKLWLILIGMGMALAYSLFLSTKAKTNR